VRPAPPARGGETRRRHAERFRARDAHRVPVRRAGRRRRPGHANRLRIERPAACAKSACFRRRRPVALNGDCDRPPTTGGASDVPDAQTTLIRRAGRRRRPVTRTTGAPRARPRAADRRASGAARPWRRSAAIACAAIPRRNGQPRALCRQVSGAGSSPRAENAVADDAQHSLVRRAGRRWRPGRANRGRGRKSTPIWLAGGRRAARSLEPRASKGVAVPQFGPPGKRIDRTAMRGCILDAK
jgi:hypothetical protein